MARRAVLSVAVLLLAASPVFGQLLPESVDEETQPVQQQQSQLLQPPKQPPKQQVQKFATCKEAVAQTPGYGQLADAVKNCPELAALQDDPKSAMTFFVPTDKAVKAMADHIGIPLNMVASPKFKGIMCNVLKYHVVPGVHLKKNWTVGQQLVTSYNNAALSVSAVGQQPAVTTATGTVANIKRVSFCGNSVAFGIDSVLVPFKLPKLGRIVI